MQRRADMRIIQWVVDSGFTISLIINALLFIPQIVTICRTKSAENISLTTFLGFNVIQIFTALHGLINQDYILAIGTSLSILTCGAVTFLIIYFNCFQPTN